MNNDASLGRLLSREGTALPLFDVKKHSELNESLKLFKKAIRLMNDPNRQIETLWLSCLNLCHFGTIKQFDVASATLESELRELGSQVDANQLWLGYEKLAVANATMWERFQDKRYMQKSQEMFYKAKEIYNSVHQSGDSYAHKDIYLEQAELKLANSQILQMTKEEILQMANNILIKGEKIGDPKVVAQMKEFIDSHGKNIPDTQIIV